MTRMRMALSAALVTLAAAGVSAADNDFAIRGCVTSATAPNVVTPSNFFWSRSDIMLAAAEARPDAVPMPDRIFYWLDDDEDLAKHRGQRVEIKGELRTSRRAR